MAFIGNLIFKTTEGYSLEHSECTQAHLTDGELP
jgi:hypothetical protein